MKPVDYRFSWRTIAVTFVASIALAAIAARIPDQREARLRTAGGVFQLLGVALVALGISDVRRSFGLPATSAEIAEHLAGWLRLQWTLAGRFVLGETRSPTTIGAVGVAMDALLGKVRTTARPSAQSTLDERLTMLEQTVWNMEPVVANVDDGLRTEIANRQQAVESERDERIAAAGQLDEKLKQFAVGGVRLQTLGLLWLLLGICLSNWSNELAGICLVKG